MERGVYDLGCWLEVLYLHALLGQSGTLLRFEVFCFAIFCMATGGVMYPIGPVM